MLTLPYPPSANRLWRNYGNRTVKTAEARNYRVQVGWLAKAAGLECLGGDVAVTIRVYRPRKSGDLDNRIKAVLDALQGVAYDNDGQIARLFAERHDDKHDPRVEVEIEEICA